MLNGLIDLSPRGMLEISVDGCPRWYYSGYTKREAIRKYRHQFGIVGKRVNWLDMTRRCVSVVSIAEFCPEPLRTEIRKSDDVRNLTLARCLAIPSYKYKSLEWKNRYYDCVKKRVMREMGLV